MSKSKSDGDPPHGLHFDFQNVLFLILQGGSDIAAELSEEGSKLLYSVSLAHAHWKCICRYQR